MHVMASDTQRAEFRVRSKGRFALVVEGTDEPIVANVCDVSPSGIGLEAPSSVPIGAAVRLDGDGIVADGVVRYCRPEDGYYRIGVALIP
jgi:hypothetical protein